MAANTRVKFCGLRTTQDIDTAASAQSAYIGLVFFEKSPRNVTIDQARALALHAPIGLAKVALVVDADNDALDTMLNAVPIDMLQLHGSETPERVAEVKARYGLPVMKAVGVATQDDLPKLESYLKVADQILVDAKAPKDAQLPGGNGLSFDWRLIAGRRWPIPWMLAGGLTTDNVQDAIEMTRAPQVDVSSGIESEVGVKDHALMMAFADAAKAE